MGAHREGLEAIREAAGALASEDGWLKRPSGSWLPEPEESSIRNGLATVS
jgi:hypothetical protein